MARYLWCFVFFTFTQWCFALVLAEHSVDLDSFFVSMAAIGDPSTSFAQTNIEWATSVFLALSHSQEPPNSMRLGLSKGCWRCLSPGLPKSSRHLCNPWNVFVLTNFQMSWALLPGLSDPPQEVMRLKNDLEMPHDRQTGVTLCGWPWVDVGEGFCGWRVFFILLFVDAPAWLLSFVVLLCFVCLSLSDMVEVFLIRRLVWGFCAIVFSAV